MSWLRRRKTSLPPALSAALGAEERVVATAQTRSGELLAASRFGLWVAHAESAVRLDWHLISRARLSAAALEIVVADQVSSWPDGTVLVMDREPVVFRLEHTTRLTDQVHQRVRGSVVASHYVPWAGAGGWAVLRRIAGRDGLVAQLRLDPGADPNAAGFADGVARVLDALWPETVDRTDRE